MEPIEQQLTELVADWKIYKEKSLEEVKNFGTVTAETKSALASLDERVTKIQTQLDAVDLKMSERHLREDGHQVKSVGELFTESDRYKAAKEEQFQGQRSYSFPLKTSAFPRDEKAVISNTGLGDGTSGVFMPTRLPGIVGMPVQELRIRDLIPSIRTDGHSFDWIKQVARTNGASPQVEGETKSESTYDWSVESGVIRTLAHFTNVTRQVLDDFARLRALIDGELMYGLKLKEEAEILAGDGTGEHLDGIITQATAYDTALYNPVSGYTKLDQLRRAKLQVRLAGLATYAASGMVLHPADMAELELLKDGEGLYIIGNPVSGTEVKLVWGLPVVESDSIAKGTFLVGAFATAAEIVDRMNAVIAISFEHDVNFTKNLATILCEERIGLAVKRPGAFVYGSFGSSPA